MMGYKGLGFRKQIFEKRHPLGFSRDGDLKYYLDQSLWVGASLRKQQPLPKTAHRLCKAI